MADRVFPNTSEYITGHGNLTKDPKEIAEGVYALSVAANYTKTRLVDDEWVGEDGVNFRDIIVKRPYSEGIKNLSKGDAVQYHASVAGREWEDKDGESRHSEQLTAIFIGKDYQFEGYKKKGGGSNRSSSSSSKSSSKSSSRASSGSSDSSDDVLDMDF